MGGDYHIRASHIGYQKGEARAKFVGFFVVVLGKQLRRREQ